MADRSAGARRARAARVAPGAGEVVLPAAGAIDAAGDESLLRLVLDTTRDAYISMDGDGAITDWNPAAEVLFGWSRSEAVGRTLAETVIPERLREAHLQAVRRFTAGGAPRHVGRVLDLPAVHRSGREFPVELAVAPLRVGDEWRFCAFLRDATERVAARSDPARQAEQMAATERLARLGTWDWDAAERTLVWSPELCRIYGVDRGFRPTPGEFFARTHADDRERVRRAIEEAVAGGGEYEFEYRIVRPDGGLAHLHGRGTVLRDGHGEVVRLMGTAQDVTDRVEAEAENRRHAAVIASTDDAVFTKDRQACITTWNRGAERLYGYTRDDVLGRPVRMLLPPSRVGEELMVLSRILAGERVEQYETQRLTRAGDVIDVSLTVSPVRDASGRIAEASVITRDITARKRAERQLERYVADIEALALRDPLTGLLTPVELHSVLERELARARRERSACSMVLLDVDGLASVNHEHGRQAGDRLLRELAEVVTDAAAGHVAGRVGDDEIAVVVSGADARSALALAQRIGDRWKQTSPLAGLSAGIAAWPDDGPDKDQVLERARDALRSGKPGRPRATPEPPSDEVLAPRPQSDTDSRVIALLRRHLGMEVAYLSEFVGDRQVVRTVDAAGDHPGIACGTTVALADSYCLRMVEADLPSVIPDTAQNAVTAALAVTEQASLGSYVGVPVRLSDGRLYGSLCCASRSARADLDESATHFARVCARLIADLVEQRELADHNRRLHGELTGVRALLAALDARDHYTGAHSEAVVALAVAVARRIGLPSDDVSAIEQVALLHDIGKIGIPDSILQKPGPLDRDEWQVMREHPVIGARIVASISSLTHLAPAVRAEHERWDGQGYPDGLAGDDIPIASRVILACDALHAMTSDRPYRAAMPLAAALDELRDHAGRQFDPAVVDALLAEVPAAEVPVAEVPAAGRRDAEHRDERVSPVLIVEDNANLRLALQHGLAAEGFDVEAVADAAAAYRSLRERRPGLIVLDWILPGEDSGAVTCRKLRGMCPSAQIVIFTGSSDERDERAAMEAGADAFLQKGMPLEALSLQLHRLARSGASVSPST
jgi:PAS domain S-box-containing protein/diguanylate cyclase (GGDEF)-like protein